MAEAAALRPLEHRGKRSLKYCAAAFTSANDGLGSFRHFSHDSLRKRARVRENAAGEAITTLRQLLRTEKETIRRDAAKLLLAAIPNATSKPDNNSEPYPDGIDDNETRQLDQSITEVERTDPGSTP